MLLHAFAKSYLKQYWFEWFLWLPIFGIAYTSTIHSYVTCCFNPFYTTPCPSTPIHVLTCPFQDPLCLMFIHVYRLPIYAHPCPSIPIHAPPFHSITNIIYHNICISLGSKWIFRKKLLYVNNLERRHPYINVSPQEIRFTALCYAKW